MENMIQCTISGSFNHYYSNITKFHENISQNKIYNILSPGDMNIRDQSTDFILLKSDVSDKINQIEESHLTAISKSNLLFVVNPKDYIGISTALEIGYAKALQIPIQFLEKSKLGFKNKIKLETFYTNNRKYAIQHDEKKNRCYLDNFVEDFGKKSKYKVIASKNHKINVLKNSEFCLIDNPDGNITIENAFKIGYAYALNIPVILTEEPSDILLNDMIVSLPVKNAFNKSKFVFKLLLKQNMNPITNLKLFYHKNKSLLQFI